MTDTTTQTTQQQAPAFPVHKGLWAEITDYLGNLPYRVAGAMHGVAKKGLEASQEVETHVGVAPEFLNAVINVLAEQPAAAVGGLLEKVDQHVRATNEQIANFAQEQAQRAAAAATAAATTIVVPDTTAKVAQAPTATEATVATTTEATTPAAVDTTVVDTTATTTVAAAA